MYEIASGSITINGTIFKEVPCSCYACPWWAGGRDDKSGWCVTFQKRKWRYDNVPKRCRELFEKGFKIGGDLVIIIKD